MIADRNFDDIAKKFNHNIYGTTKGRIRQIIVWQDIEFILSKFNHQRPLTILDAGGGQGQIAIKLAQLGHKVTICDISQEMLNIAKEQADESSVTLNYHHGSIQEMAERNITFDIVICHAVLEWVENPNDILSSLNKLLAQNGYLSLMFYNIHGLLFKTLTLGNFGYVQAGLSKRKKKTLSPDYPRDPHDVYQWLSQLGLVILQKTGIRVFHDYLVNKDQQESRFDELIALEQQFCRKEPYVSLARYIHVVAQKDKI